MMGKAKIKGFKNFPKKEETSSKQLKISSYFLTKPNISKISSGNDTYKKKTDNPESSKIIKKKEVNGKVSDFNIETEDIISDNSDIEIIEGTPESLTKNVYIKSLKEDADSPDFIAPTPIRSNINGNHTCLSKKFKSILPDFDSSKNQEDTNKQLSKIYSKNDLYKKPTSLKREAESGTGVSPNAKKSSESNEKISNSHCKVNLFSQKNSLLVSETSESENELSFSILQVDFKNIESHSDNTKDYIVNKENLSYPSVSRSGSSVFKNSSIIEEKDLFDLECSPLAKNEENQNLIKGNISDVESSPLILNSEITKNGPHSNNESTDESYFMRNKGSEKATNNFSANEDEYNCQRNQLHSNSNINNPISNILDSSLASEDSLDKLLSDNFDKLSPFKNSKPQSIAKTVELSNSLAVEKLLSEGLGNASFAVRKEFGRYVVELVERNIYEREMVLHIKSPLNRARKKCNLTGFWYESMVKEGDIVHILFAEQEENVFYISNEKGIIVINPDYLVSGTSVVSGVFCRRKAVLNERFKGYDSGNKIMIVGSLVHQLFQEVVKEKITNHPPINSLIHRLITHPKFLMELFGLNLTEEEVYEEMKSFIPLIVSWSRTYLSSNSSEMAKVPKDNWKGKVSDIKDIEENIWSPRFGIKGKIDLTVETRVNSRSKIIPLELKTGKSSFSAEHQGQVTLYSMMMSDRREDPQAGLLLYLRTGQMAEVPAGEKEKKALIQLRNDLVKFLSQSPQENKDQVPQLPNLPSPLDSQRTCSRCFHLLTCTSLQKAQEEVPPETHAMSSLISASTSHLSENHIEYFRRWCLMLHLEIGATANEASIRSLWCLDPQYRESSGTCLANMVVEGTEDKGNGYVLHRMQRDPELGMNRSLPQCFQYGDNVVVSSEEEIALALGAVYSTEGHSITISLDRTLVSDALKKKRRFLIDRCEYQNNMSIFFTNISELLRDTDRSKRLRELIIDKYPPDFQKGVDRKVVQNIRDILLNLNDEQRRAVLRSLLAKDYSILKGFPGTGKTMTIVGLVRILNATGHSVLLTSYTHSAVDNILLKLKEHKELKFVRLGKASRIHQQILSFSDAVLSKDMKSLKEIEEFYLNANIVATTCLGMNHVLFRRKIFDYCIIDEASQVVEAAALGPLFFCSRFILVGDSLQLPPVIKSPSAKKLGMMQSLFERLDAGPATVCLVSQYRMNDPIMKIANHLIYDGQLKLGTEALRSATIQYPKLNEEVEELEDWLCHITSPSIEKSVLLIDTIDGAFEERNCSGQPINPKEARVICEILRKFINKGITPDEVGVITPYRAQVKLLKEKIGDLHLNVEVNTVDQYQGRDKTVILYSCVRSGINEEEIKKGEILNDIRRLNVAVTRAKRKLIILGNFKTLCYYEPFKKLFDSVHTSQVYPLQEGIQGFSWITLNNI